MKHVFSLFLLWSIPLALLFAFFCTEVTFAAASPEISVREEEGMPVISLSLPQKCARASRAVNEFLASLPPVIYEPCRFLASSFYGLLSDAKQAYKSDLCALP